MKKFHNGERVIVPWGLDEIEGVVEPVRRLPGIDRWAGLWVAIKAGEIIAAAESSSELTYRLRQMGPSARGAVTEFVRPSHENTYVVGVG